MERIPFLLMQFKLLSNPNYHKLTNYLQSFLHKSQLQQSINRFVHISRNTQISPYQMSVIMKGFILFWKQQQMDWGIFTNRMVPLINEIPPSISTEYIAFIHAQSEKMGKGQLHELQGIIAVIGDQLVNSKNRNQRSKVIALFHYFSLQIAPDKIVRIILQQGNVRESAFAFTNIDKTTNTPLLGQFIEQCSNSNKLKQAQTIIKSLKITNISQFPSLNQKLQSKYLRYQLTTHKLYFIQLNIQHSQSLLINLINTLVRQGKRKEAIHFINKYKLKHIKFNLSPEEINSTKYFKNILIQKDGWGVTQQVVFAEEQQQQQQENSDRENSNSHTWMTLAELGYQKKSVIWINAANIDKVIERMEKYFPEGKKIGIDSQTVGGIHVFDPIVTTILQVCAAPKIFIFDLLSLGDNSQMKQLLYHIGQKCIIVGHGIHNEVSSIFTQVKADHKCLASLRKIDTQQMFKKKYPSQTKCSLAFICQYLFNKQLSKYEQCSGWRNRPLRDCQLHYAALDAALPLAIQSKLK